MHSPLRKGVKWHWDEDQQKSFAELKDRLCSTEVLHRPDSSLPYLLATDWSQQGMGAILSQTDVEGKKHPTSFASRTCNPAEENYGSCEGECLAVVWATQHFREYLFGTPFTLITDHEPLRWLMQTNKTTRKLARWSLLLKEYDMTVVHKRGVLNTNADCLSRYPKKASGKEPILPDWNRGDHNMSPEKVFSFMSTVQPDNEQLLQSEIWDDLPVLHFLKTHQYLTLSPLEKDHVYRRARGFRWLAHQIYKVQREGPMLLVVPLVIDREELVQKIHRDKGHYGIHRMLDRLCRTYWWKGMDETVKSVLQIVCHVQEQKQDFACRILSCNL